MNIAASMIVLNENHLQRLSVTTSGRAVQDGTGSNAAST